MFDSELYVYLLIDAHTQLFDFSIRIRIFVTCIVWTHQAWKSYWFVLLSCDKSGVLMVTPLILAITPMTVLQDPLLGPQYCRLFEEGGVDDRLLIMLFLLIEHARGESSFWAPYPSILNPLCLELHYFINWTWTAPVNFRVHNSVWWLQLVFSLIANELCEYGTGESLDDHSDIWMCCPPSLELHFRILKKNFWS